MKVTQSTVVLLALLFVSLCGIGIVTADDPIDSCAPLPEAYDAMESDAAVTVKTVVEEAWKESNFYYAFEPNKVDPTTGFIIYPGAFVDPIAYAPPAHEIAAEGYLVIIVKMPDDLAIYGVNRANKIISAYDEIEKWIIGGHSMGGAGACSYAKDFTENVVGVVLWAAYPTEIWRIDDKDLKAISIYGTKNLNIENFPASAEHLPADTQWVIIEGGNHFQFGWYDANSCPEEMDRTPADITREEQQEQMIQATLGFLESFVTTTTTSIQSSSTTTTTITGSSCPSTRIYGEYSKEVEILRYCRDNVLSQTPEGRELIRLYYEWSPAITEVMDNDDEFKKDLKELIDGVLGLTNEAIK